LADDAITAAKFAADVTLLAPAEIADAVDASQTATDAAAAKAASEAVDGYFDATGRIALSVSAQQAAALAANGRRTLYLDATAADDTGSGLAPETAKKTLAGIAAILASGDKVVIAQGTYTGVLDLTATGLNRNNVWLQGAGRGLTTITYSGVTPTIEFSNQTGCRFSDLTVAHTDRYMALYASAGADDARVENVVATSLRTGLWVVGERLLIENVYTTGKEYGTVLVCDSFSVIRGVTGITTGWEDCDTAGVTIEGLFYAEDIIGRSLSGGAALAQASGVELRASGPCIVNRLIGTAASLTAGTCSGVWTSSGNPPISIMGSPSASSIEYCSIRQFGLMPFLASKTLYASASSSRPSRKAPIVWT
jgi:hypothetical protein